MTFLLPRIAVVGVAAVCLATGANDVHLDGLREAIKLREKGRSHEAGVLLEQLVQNTGAPPQIGARLHNALGLVRRDQGRPDEAAKYFETALRGIPENTTDCALRPTIIGNLGEARVQQGRLREARVLFENAMRLANQCGGNERTFASLQMLNLAGLARLEGDYELARKLCEGAQRELTAKLGADHPHSILALNNLAQIYASQGRQKQSIRLMERVRELARNVHGERHPLYSGATSNLGVAWYGQKRYEEAEALFRESLTVTETTYGPTHPAVFRDLNNLAAVLDSTGRTDEAQQLLQRVIVSSRSTSRPDVRAMASMGTIELSRGRIDEAAGWYTEVSQLIRSGSAAPDPDLARRLEQVAVMLRKIQRPAEAERYQAEATRIRTRALIDIDALRQLNYSELWKGNRQ